MGNAVRCQMDTRICLRVRERRDTDLIFSQGAHAADWHAHGRPRQVPDLGTWPRRHYVRRGYLLTEERARAYSSARPSRAAP
jgi:S-DNA-T family DNA segregation ATPase FtsK/SpoIIIE